MNLAILGATGEVGTQMRECLLERNIKIDKLKLLASKRSAGEKVKFGDKEIVVEEVNDSSFENMDFVLGAVGNELAKTYAPHIVKAGAVFIDNSSAFRQKENVPLVVPEINKDDIFKHEGIIANPNCSTIITLMAVAPINNISKIKRMVATTFQAVSGAGHPGLVELETQLDTITKGKINIKTTKEELPHNTFKHQIANNIIPQIGSKVDNLFTTEEMKMQNEGRKIMHLPDLVVDCTCVRIPVMRSHSISVTLDLEKKASVEEVRNAVKNFKNVELKDDIDNDIYPMPLFTQNRDIVEVGRIRESLVFENGISLFCSGDQIRKGAATNAVEILEELIK